MCIGMANGWKQNHIADDGKMMSKMTDERIIKALKHCYEHKSCNDCVGCLGAEECILNVDPAGDIYPIIRRQQAEIEKLNVELVGMRGACESYKMHYDNAKAEIERLKNRLKKERHQFEDLGKMYSEIRAEAIKEFADRLKENYNKPLFFVGGYIDFIRVVDNLVKEMVGEGK